MQKLRASFSNRLSSIRRSTNDDVEGGDISRIISDAVSKDDPSALVVHVLQVPRLSLCSGKCIRVSEAHSLPTPDSSNARSITKLFRSQKDGKKLLVRLPQDATVLVRCCGIQD